jgi:hypothetical protein
MMGKADTAGVRLMLEAWQLTTDVIHLNAGLIRF